MKRGTIVATNDDAHINTLHITACRDRAQFLLISIHFLLESWAKRIRRSAGAPRSRPELTPAAAAAASGFGGIYICLWWRNPSFLLFLDNVGRLHFPPRRILWLSFFDASVSIISSSFHLVSIQIVFFFFFVPLSLSLALPMSRKKTSIDELSTFSRRQTAATARCALIALMALFVCVFVALSSLLNKQVYIHKCLRPNDNFIFALHVSTNHYN